jgi:hypothetical protein
MKIICSELSYKICILIEEYNDHNYQVQSLINREKEVNNYTWIITEQELEECNQKTVLVIKELLIQLHENSINEDFSFFDAPFNVYMNYFESRLEKYLGLSQDAIPKDFIEDELSFFNDPSENRVLKLEGREEQYYQFVINDIKSFEISLKRKKEFLEEKLKATAESKIYNDKIFKSFEDEECFNYILNELDALDENKKSADKFPAKANSIYKRALYKNVILKYKLNLKKYIEFLNRVYNLNQKYFDKLSEGKNYDDDVDELIETYLNK